MTTFREIFGRKIQQIMVLVSNSIIIVFLCWVVYQGAVFADGIRETTVPVLFYISEYYPYMIMPIGLSITLIYYILTSILIILGSSEAADEQIEEDN
jgi:TRAP-type C4-dicarboxylate transport system permease small subunit